MLRQKTTTYEEIDITLQNGVDYTNNDCTEHYNWSGVHSGQYTRRLTAERLQEVVKAQLGGEWNWSWFGFESHETGTTQAKAKRVISEVVVRSENERTRNN